MGQEITHSQFSSKDFEHFSDHLREETALLHQWLADGVFRDDCYQAGFELEAWLLGKELRPAPENEAFLQQLNDPLAVPELARFNFELNGQHRDVIGNVFSLMHQEIHRSWKKCIAAAEQLDLSVAAIGTLPTAELEDFTLANMSTMQRYLALNEQVLRMRAGKPLFINIQGHEALDFSHPDVMLEAATTSFQIHLRMPISKAVRLYNAGKILSAPMTAISANSPFLLGHDLWAETRIPVFEQSVLVGQSDLTRRVSYGIRYAHESIMEIFNSNLARYPIMLPMVMNKPPEAMAHLRLHNGTIWRWNRPLVGFDEDGTPHFRLEHRCVPAGPSMRDLIANSAFFYGLVCALADQQQPLEDQLPFEQAKQNFYQCARDGLNAKVSWPGYEEVAVSKLCADVLLPLAEQGLHNLGIHAEEIGYWLSIIESRLQTEQNGAVWQRAWVARHGNDMRALMRAYLLHQQADVPVHEWGLD